MDAFDQWWEWANKALDDQRTIDVRIWRPISEMAEEDRLDRAKVNEAVARCNRI